MSLLERMSQEHLEMLKVEEQRFPTTIKNLRSELANNTHWIELSYQSIHTLYLHLDLKDYSPSTISNLFDHVSS